MEKIVLGGGCFWCLDAAFRLIKGVEKTVCGFAGGSEKTAEYYTVAGGNTGHAEVVEITFDTTVLSLKDMLDIFFTIHNPTTKDRQGNDVGTEYRSVIFYKDDAQLTVANEAIDSIRPLWDDPIVTEVSKLAAFYPAEDYHQDYFNKNPGAGYCQIIINPKLKKLREKFAARIKD